MKTSLKNKTQEKKERKKKKKKRKKKRKTEKGMEDRELWGVPYFHPKILVLIDPSNSL